MEIWKDITWYEWLYEVSNMGRIKSLNYKRKWVSKIIKWSLSKYINVSLCDSWIIKVQSIHRIVATEFIENKENKRLVNHKNWIKTDNKVSNLEWNTDKENMIHSVKVLKNKHWVKRFWKDNPNSIPIVQLDKKGKIINTWESMHCAEKWTKVSISSICMCCKGIRKTAWWFKWKYL